jgi:hypothetical protein
MPFRSDKQRRYMFAAHPRIARRWVREARAKHQAITTRPKKKAGRTRQRSGKKR